MQFLNLFNIIKSNTCFKGNGTCIDLILANRKCCFKHSSIFETGLSDHHLIILYRDYKNFHQVAIKRSALKRNAIRTKQQEDIAKFKKLRNLVVKLNRETKLTNFETSKNSKPV